MEVKPFFSTTDFVGEYASSGFPRYDASGLVQSAQDGTQAGMEFDPIAKVVHPRAVFLPHDQKFAAFNPGGYDYTDRDCFSSDSGNPYFFWAMPPRESVGTADYSLPDPAEPGFQALRFDTADGNPFAVLLDGAPCIASQAYTGFMKFGPPGNLGGYISAAGYRWRVVGSSRGTYRWFEVTWQSGDGVWFRYNDVNDADGSPDDNYWVDVDQIGQGSQVSDTLSTQYAPNTGDDPNAGDPPVHTIYVKVMGGLMQVTIDSDVTPYVWTLDLADSVGEPDWVIDWWQMIAFDILMVEWSVHATKWRASAAIASNEINLGFVPSSGQLSTMLLRAHYLPTYRQSDGSAAPYTNYVHVGFRPDGTGADLETWSVNGVLYQYLLTINNIETGTWKGFAYADFTAAVHAVTIDFAASTYSKVQAPTVLGTLGAPPNPQSIEITKTFDLDRLTITSTCAMTFRNFTGLWTNWNNNGIVDMHGHMAAQVNLGIGAYGTTRSEFLGIWNTRFTNDWKGGGNDDVTIFGDDISLMLRVPAFNLPWMDGWNVYYALAFLAAMGGITLNQLAFATYVPANPYDPSPGLVQQYYLPTGPAGTALTRFTGGQLIWDIMLKIAQSIGFMLFFGVDGYLYFFKFGLVGIPSIVKTFNYVAGAYGGGAGLDEIFMGTYESGLYETRNSVTVIGVSALGPLWNPIVAWDTDTDSVYNDYVWNYKGYFDPTVWVDNIFADQAFAGVAAESLLNFLRLPDKSLKFSTWYPGDIGVYPNMFINIVNPRSSASNFTFFVVGTHVTVGKGKIPQMDITARIVPQLY
jgi:hypothetical protein